MLNEYIKEREPGAFDQGISVGHDRGMDGGRADISPSHGMFETVDIGNMGAYDIKPQMFMSTSRTSARSER
jgi:hypothetical protein